MNTLNANQPAFAPDYPAFGTVSESGVDACASESAVRRETFRVVPAVRLAFYAYVASIPFETVNLGTTTEITTLTLAVLLLSTAFQPSVWFRKWPAAFGFFVLYFVIFSLPAYTSTPTIYVEEAKWQVYVFGQLMLMSWLAMSIMRSERVARGMLITLGASCLIVAVLQFAGISDTDAGNRLTAFGFHPNNIARILSVGLLAIVGLRYAVSENAFRSRLIVPLAVPVIGLAIIGTGSRGGLIALGAGLLALTIKKGAASVKLRNTAIVVVAIGLFVAMVLDSQVDRDRFAVAIEDGKLARREQIYPAALGLFLEKPLFGWGAKVAEYELGAELAHPEEDSKNPHNLILYALIASGAIGSIPLFAGLWLCLLTAYKRRGGPRGVLPLSLLLMVLVANMSGLWLHNKLHWLVIAYVLSAPAAFARRALDATIGSQRVPALD